MSEQQVVSEAIISKLERLAADLDSDATVMRTAEQQTRLHTMAEGVRVAIKAVKEEIGNE